MYFGSRLLPSHFTSVFFSITSIFFLIFVAVRLWALVLCYELSLFWFSIGHSIAIVEHTELTIRAGCSIRQPRSTWTSTKSILFHTFLRLNRSYPSQRVFTIVFGIIGQC